MGNWKNTSESRRRWDSIQLADGHTLELDPEGVAELTLPDDFEDPFLKPTTEQSTPTPAPENVTRPSATEEVEVPAGYRVELVKEDGTPPSPEVPQATVEG